MNTLFIALHNIIKKPLIPVFLFFTLLSSATAFAQTVGNSKLSCDISNRNPCTSKDLEIVSVAIDAPACTSCTPGQTVTYPLKMTIHNGTKSERTSFALYGSLSSGATINGKSGDIFVCVGPITVKSDQTLPGESAPGNQTFAVGSITFTCGQDLTLSNNYLAWTDAAGTTADRCNTFSNATKCSDIAPKCGTASSITIVGPVLPPTLGKVDPTCTVSTGCVTVTSSKTGYTFSLDGGAFTAYPTNGWCGLAPGEHCVRSKRTSDGCISPETCITISGAPANPAAPQADVTQPTCTVATGTIEVTSPTGTGYSYSKDGTNFQTSPTFRDLSAGTYTITVKNSDGCTNSAQFTINSQPPTPAAPQATVTQPTCTVATGTIQVTSPTGTGYSYSKDGTNFQTSPIFGDLSAGTYTITVKNSDGCTNSAQFTVNSQPATPAAPVVTIQEATICGTNTTPSVTVCSPIAGTYILKQDGEPDQTKVYPTNATIKFDIKPGLGGFTLTVTNTDGCISEPADCDNDVSSCPAPPQPRAITTTTVKPQTSVLAAPNPFSDRVKFTFKSTVSGKGSLELYNLLGQRVKTVYQGYIEKGQAQTIDYNVPNAQRTNLIYMFRVGNERVSGKLIGLK